MPMAERAAASSTRVRSWSAMIDHLVDQGDRVGGRPAGQQEGLGGGRQLRLAEGSQELGDQAVPVRPDVGHGEPPVGQGGDGSAEEGLEAGRAEPDPEGAAPAVQLAGEAAGQHPHDPRAAPLDQVHRRVGKGVLGVGARGP